MGRRDVARRGGKVGSWVKGGDILSSHRRGAHLRRCRRGGSGMRGGVFGLDPRGHLRLGFCGECVGLEVRTGEGTGCLLWSEKRERPRDALTLGFWGIRQRRLTRARGRKLTRRDGNFVGNLVNFQVLRRGGVPRGDRRRGRRENSRGRARRSASVEKNTGDKESSARGVREAMGRSKRAGNARGSTTTHVRRLESLGTPNARSTTLREVAIRRCRLVENFRRGTGIATTRYPSRDEKRALREGAERAFRRGTGQKRTC